MAINRAWSFVFVYWVVLNFAACRDKTPDTHTTIQGVVIDQDGRVIKNAGINMYGSEQRGLKQVTVFNVTVFTDSNGSYKVSQLLPKATDVVDIRPVSSDSVSLDRYLPYIDLKIDGNYIALTSTYTLPKETWGTTLPLNFKFQKK